MPASQLWLYNGTPFIASTQVNLDDTFTGDGVTTTFTLVNKTVAQLGATIQAGNVEYYQYNGGFTTNTGANTFTLATAPGIGVQIVAPGVIQAVFSAFDQPVVPGLSNPRTATVPLWIVDASTIPFFTYGPLPIYPGIQISVVQLITGSNAQTSWFQLASADASGNAMTFGATGAPLYLPSLNGFGTLTPSASSSQTTITYNASSGQFWAGEYVSINPGGSSQEIVHVISVGASSLTLDPTGLTYNHYSGELLFGCGWKFWLQGTIPINANNNTAVNLYNLGIQRLGSIAARP